MNYRTRYTLYCRMCAATGQTPLSIRALLVEDRVFRAVLARRVEPKLKRGKRAA